MPGLPGGPAGSNCQGGRNSGTDTTRDSDDQLINQLVCDDQYPFDEDHLNNHPLTDDNHIYHRQWKSTYSSEMVAIGLV